MPKSSENTNYRILVVDDESSISDLISTSLRFVGFDVRTAATGSEALTVAEEFKPHAVVLDVMLPDSDGFEVCRQLRSEGLNIGVLSALIQAGVLDSFVSKDRCRLVLEAQTFNILTDREKRNIVTLGDKYNYDILKTIADCSKDQLVGDENKRIFSDKRFNTFKTKDS